jgi:predicted nuclease of predicted toxin-antitoxin system
MRLYLDDDSARAVLVRLLSADGHDMVIPADLHTDGADDAVHFRQAIRADRVLLTHNYGDFDQLHELVMEAGGHHPGIFIVRRDNDPTKDLSPKGIIRAIRAFLAAAPPLRDSVVILNQWR